MSLLVSLHPVTPSGVALYRRARGAPLACRSRLARVKVGSLAAVRCVDGRRPCLAGRGVLPSALHADNLHYHIQPGESQHPWQLFCTPCPDPLRSARVQRFEPPRDSRCPAGVGDAWSSFSGPARLPRDREPPPGCPRSLPRRVRRLPAPGGAVDVHASIGRDRFPAARRPWVARRRRSSPRGSRRCAQGTRQRRGRPAAGFPAPGALKTAPTGGQHPPSGAR